MFLTVMPDTKEHLVSKGVAFGSLTALAESVGKDSSFHFSLVSAFRRLCVPRKKSDEEKRLEHEMEPAQAGPPIRPCTGGQCASDADCSACGTTGKCSSPLAGSAHPEIAATCVDVPAGAPEAPAPSVADAVR